VISKLALISLEKPRENAHNLVMETKPSQSISKVEKLTTAKPKTRPRVAKFKAYQLGTDVKAIEVTIVGKSVTVSLLKQHLQLLAVGAIKKTEQKFDYQKIARVFEGWLTDSELTAAIYAEKLPQVATKKSRPLGSLEIDRASRLARIVELSERVFGDTEKSSRWLRKPRSKLAGQTPLELIATDAGGAVVEEMLHRIDHGMFA
jgi:putative toxin-antitoxin system antitoxin component (TIGR02293 family)